MLYELVHGDRELQKWRCGASLSYVSSWVNDKLDRCYQLMETENRALVDKWIANWIDIADFEVHPVITSSEAAEKIGPRVSNIE
jgi:hypothetical protein